MLTLAVGGIAAILVQSPAVGFGIAFFLAHNVQRSALISPLVSDPESGSEPLPREMRRLILGTLAVALLAYHALGTQAAILAAMATGLALWPKRD